MTKTEKPEVINITVDKEVHKHLKIVSATLDLKLSKTIGYLVQMFYKNSK